jgi:hypothetical protein
VEVFDPASTRESLLHRISSVIRIFTLDCQLTQSITSPPFITPRRTEYRSPLPTVPLLFRAHPLPRKRSNALVSTNLSVAAETCLANRYLAMDVSCGASLTALPAFRHHVTIRIQPLRTDYTISATPLYQPIHQKLYFSSS